MTMIGKVSEISWKFEWEIHDFFSYIKDDSSYLSPYFDISGSSWYIEISPMNKDDKILERCVSLHLFRRFYSKASKTFEFRLGIKTAYNTVVNELEASHNFEENGLGWPAFIKRSELLSRQSELLPSGILTVTCFVKVKHTIPDFESSCSNLAKDLKTLFISEANSDATLYIKGTNFRVHMTILAARSPVFAALFKSDMIMKKIGKVYKLDFDPEAFGVFLSFLYTGEVDFSKCNVCNLYKISDEYEVSHLNSMCVDYMTGNLSIDNFCEILVLGNEFKENDLLAFMQKFFNKNFEAIVSSNSWELLLETNFRFANALLKAIAPKINVTE